MPDFIYTSKKVLDSYLEYQIQVNSEVLVELEERKYELDDNISLFAVP